MGRGLFISGTDTGVGKTLAAAVLARALRRRGHDVGVFKPLQSGGVRQGGTLIATDADVLRSAAGCDDALDEVAPYRFAEELAPIILLEQQGRSASLPHIAASYERLARRHACMLVEGVGGLAVPLFDQVRTVELVRRLALPVLVVARAGLGTVNHTLLTLSYAERAGLEVLGVLWTTSAPRPDGSEAGNRHLVARFGGAPRDLGCLPHLAALAVQAVPTAEMLDALAPHLDVDLVVERLGLPPAPAPISGAL